MNTEDSSRRVQNENMGHADSMTSLNDALGAIGEALEPLSDESKRRVLRWAADYFGEPIGGSRSSCADDEKGKGEANREYADVADLFAASSAKTQAEKAMVVAYWTQVLEGKSSFTGYQINSQLKDLGHGVGNITDVFSKLMRREPQCVIQVKKSGTSRQARKLYKLTKAGIDEVEGLLGVSAEEG